jgi:hypothetical protein
MEWFFIEALVALLVAIFIVWWTMAPQRKLPRDVEKSGDAKSRAIATPQSKAEP